MAKEEPKTGKQKSLEILARSLRSWCSKCKELREKLRKVDGIRSKFEGLRFTEPVYNEIYSKLRELCREINGSINFNRIHYFEDLLSELSEGEIDPKEIIKLGKICRRNEDSSYYLGVGRCVNDKYICEGKYPFRLHKKSQ